jgi:hypothetical protein
MSVYLPPTEYTPIFDANLFPSSSISSGSTSSTSTSNSLVQVKYYLSSQTIIPPANTYKMDIMIFGAGGIAGASVISITTGNFNYGGSGAAGNMAVGLGISWNYSNSLTLTCGSSGTNTTIVFGSLGTGTVYGGGNGTIGTNTGGGTGGSANATINSLPSLTSWNNYYGTSGTNGGSLPSGTYPPVNPPSISGGIITNTVQVAGLMGAGQSYAVAPNIYSASPYVGGGCIITWYVSS